MKSNDPTIDLKPEREVKIVQFGTGNFLRGFADWMIQRMNNATSFNASVILVSNVPSSKALDALKRQDYRYYVNLRGFSGAEIVNELERIDVIESGVSPYDDFCGFMQLADMPDLRFIISNTTEAGIVFDPTCKFTDSPATSFPARLTRFLFRRFETYNGNHSKGLIILPCELIFHNGRRLKEYVGQYIDLWREDLGESYGSFKQWVNSSCYFCSTLVDRIVPGFPKDNISEIKEKIDFDDKMIVHAEPYHLWVIERPENMDIETLEKEFPALNAGLNVIFTDNETPYHERKLALLNGPHTLMSPIAFLCGLKTVREACLHPLIGSYIKYVQAEELLPTLDLPEEELTGYADSVMERFENPFVSHQVESIMLNAFPKFAARILPAMHGYYQRTGQLPIGMVLGLAAIVRFYRGGSLPDGTHIQPNDSAPILSLLENLWKSNDYRAVAEGVAGSSLLWKDEKPDSIPGLADLLALYLESIELFGMLPTLKECMSRCKG